MLYYQFCQNMFEKLQKEMLSKMKVFFSVLGRYMYMPNIYVIMKTMYPSGYLHNGDSLEDYDYLLHDDGVLAANNNEDDNLEKKI